MNTLHFFYIKKSSLNLTLIPFRNIIFLTFVLSVVYHVQILPLHYGPALFKKRGYERDEFLFRTVIKVRKIQFTQFLHTSAYKFFLRALSRYYILQPMLKILFYIALLSSKILVLFGLDSRVGNSKFQRPKIPALSALQIQALKTFKCSTQSRFVINNFYFEDNK